MRGTRRESDMAILSRPLGVQGSANIENRDVTVGCEFEVQKSDAILSRPTEHPRHYPGAFYVEAPGHRENGQSQTPSASQADVLFKPALLIPHSISTEYACHQICGFTIDGGTFNISDSQPLDPPTLPNRLSRYVKHLEARLAELEDLINLSMENNSNDQPAYGDETGAPELVRESRKDAMDHSGSMPTDSSQGTNNIRGHCRAQGLGGFHSYLPTPPVSIIPDRAGELPHSSRWTLADVGFKELSRQQFVTSAIPALQRDRRLKTPFWRKSSKWNQPETEMLQRVSKRFRTVEFPEPRKRRLGSYLSTNEIQPWERCRPPNQIHCTFLLYPPSSLAPMDEIGPAAVQKINQIVAAAGEEHLAAYIKQLLWDIIAEDAVNWLDINKFMRRLSHAIQTVAVSVPPTPAHRAPSAHRPVPGPTPMHSLAAHQSSPIPPAPLPGQSAVPPRSNVVDITDLQVRAKIKLMEEQCVLINHRNFKGLRDCNNASRRLANYHKALDRDCENELAGLSEDIPDSSDEAGPGLAPVPGGYAEQAAFLSAPMLSNFVAQLDPAEPSFPPGAGYESLDGKLEDYMYPF
ncbi:hypothetical protein DFH09DRAFT_1090095 [Mycena vulgaris]|nr:hypothetical protein DFH09DRAFT_1090095 [Mycena vulgaris]